MTSPVRLSQVENRYSEQLVLLTKLDNIESRYLFDLPQYTL
jgi:hypothetical protein